MPLSCDPTETAPVYLEFDASKPEESRPTFLARFLTRNEGRRVARLIADAQAQEDPASEKSLDEALAIQFSGWRNVADRGGEPVEFKVTDAAGVAIANFDDVLDLYDKWDLIYRAAQEVGRLKLEKKRKSPSPAPSASAPSAANAAPGENATSPKTPPDQTASTSPA